MHSCDCFEPMMAAWERRGQTDNKQHCEAESFQGQLGPLFQVLLDSQEIKTSLTIQYQNKR